MKSFLLSLVLLASAQSFAETRAPSVEITVRPARPLVLLSPYVTPSGETIESPQFKADYAIYNPRFDALTVTGIDFIVVSEEGLKMRYEANLAQPLVIQPGQTRIIENVIVAPLPLSKSFIYEVGATVRGWWGSENNWADDFSSTTHFETM